MAKLCIIYKINASNIREKETLLKIVTLNFCSLKKQRTWRHNSCLLGVDTYHVLAHAWLSIVCSNSLNNQSTGGFGWQFAFDQSVNIETSRTTWNSLGNTWNNCDLKSRLECVVVSRTMNVWFGERKENINQRLNKAPGQLKARRRIDRYKQLANEDETDKFIGRFKT